LNLTYLTMGSIVDRISNRDRQNDSSDKGALSQPLELRDSLRIRDGLGNHDAYPVQWPQFKATRLTASDLSYLWICNN